MFIKNHFTGRRIVLGYQAYVDEFSCVVPLEICNNINHLMQKKARKADREADEPHHDPSVPV